MGLWRRLFGSSGGGADERAALAAEAAGDYPEAARRWALCGQGHKVAEMHLLRAERAGDEVGRLAALRDAVRWAKDDLPVGVRARRALADALLGAAQRGSLATARDREAAKEAATLFEQLGDFAAAGAAWEALGEDDDAVRAYQKGGLVDKLEQALARDEKRARGQRRLREALDEATLHESGGDRESARAALVQAIELADDKGELRRRLEALDARRLTGGRVRLVARGKPPLLVCTERLTLGRDAACDLAITAAGVSRTHAVLSAQPGGFTVKDGGSRNGTRVAGLPIAGELSVEGELVLGLGDDVEVAARVEPSGLSVEVVKGPSRGERARLLAPGAELVLGELGVDARLRFTGGRPELGPGHGKALRLNGQRVARGVVQLCAQDRVVIDDVELEILAP